MQNISLPISVSEDPDYLKEPFSWWQAWFDLILLAASSHEEKGCVHVSERVLSERWKWKRGKVRAFLEKETQLGKIEISRQRSGNILKIPKFGKYVRRKRLLSETLETIPLLTVARELFERFYEQFYGEAYYWTAKDSSAINTLLEKIKHARIRKGMGVAQSELVQAFQLFLESITDKWILENFSISVINSKYNEIVAQAKAKNGKQKTDKRRATEVSASSPKDYEGEF